MIRLKKILNEWFTKAILICFLVLVGIGGMCENPYQTNPNLKLIAGDTIYDSTHNFNPVVSPDGGNVYYLSISVFNWTGFYDDQAGAIYSVKIDGGGVEEILRGLYNSLAISADGKKLACQSYKKEAEPYFISPESLIIVVHIIEGTVESLWISSKEKIRKLAWDNEGNYLYYLTTNAIKRLYLPDSTEEIVMSISGIKGFDLFKNDSIYLDSTIWYPEIEPTNQRYIIGTAGIFGDTGIFGDKFIMRDTQGETLFTLPDSLVPYMFSFVSQPYWLPDGNTIVFSAAEQGFGPVGNAAQIWILENLFEQIGK